MLFVFVIPVKIKNTMINILCTIFTYKDEGGSCDNGLWQVLTKVTIVLYIHNFHIKPLYIYVLWSNKYFSDSDSGKRLMWGYITSTVKLVIPWETDKCSKFVTFLHYISHSDIMYRHDIFPLQKCWFHFNFSVSVFTCVYNIPKTSNVIIKIFMSILIQKIPLNLEAHNFGTKIGSMMCLL